MVLAILYSVYIINKIFRFCGIFCRDPPIRMSCFCSRCLVDFKIFAIDTACDQITNSEVMNDRVGRFPPTGAADQTAGPVDLTIGLIVLVS